MNVMFFGMMEMLVMLAAAGGVSNDVLTAVDADDYFKSRNIQATAKQMTALAGKTPTDAKSSVQQLLAIRWLGEQKEKTARDVLQQIADGKTAQDKLGFAKDYAQAALAQIDGKPLARKVPADSVRSQAFEWFPEDVSFFGAFDSRGGLEGAALDAKDLRTQLYKFMPGEAKEAIYGFVDSVGNLRVDRVSFGLTPKLNEGMRIYVRLTGKGDRKRLAAFFKENFPLPGIKITEGDDVTTIQLSEREDDAPVFALVGDSDLIIAGYSQRNAPGKHIEVLESVLQVRAGKRTSLVKSQNPYVMLLKNVPANASGVLIGQVPDEMRRDTGMTRTFGAIPVSIAADLTLGKNLDLRFRGTMQNAAEATSFTTNVEALKKKGIEGLKMAPPALVKPEQAKALTKMIEKVKLEAQEANVSGGVQLSSEEIKVLSDLAKAAFQFYIGVGAGAKPPPPEKP